MNDGLNALWANLFLSQKKKERETRALSLTLTLIPLPRHPA